MDDPNNILMDLMDRDTVCSYCGAAGPFERTSSELWCLSCKNGWGQSMCHNIIVVNRVHITTKGLGWDINPILFEAFHIFCAAERWVALNG